jgi:hypothetical protein
MRPRRGTPWKVQRYIQQLLDEQEASMRPRRGTPWKAAGPGRRGSGWTCFNAATEGNSVESADQRDESTMAIELQCGHGGELRGKTLREAAIDLQLYLLQCGHGGELRGKLVLVVRPASWAAWGFNAATEGNSVERGVPVLPALPGRGASMRPRRGTPWKGDRNGDTKTWGGEASMRPRRGTPWKGSCIGCSREVASHAGRERPLPARTT